MRAIVLLLFVVLCISCKSGDTQVVQTETSDFREFKVLDSQYLTRVEIFEDIKDEVLRFRFGKLSSKSESENLNELILEKSIPQLQEAIYKGQFSYEDLTLFYLNRIYTYDRENPKSLNSVIALNPEALAQARAADQYLQNLKQSEDSFDYYSLRGMPILLKDNINTSNMPTTAGAAALMNNLTENAPLVDRLRNDGAVILGKANLSEWAYFFCGDCPSGYSAVGGQTLNPYGRRQLDTGGSSSGSGVAVAVNFAVAAIGTETSGSILSPASANSIVGLKPTVGTVSGEGVVPISSYLDTAGPMTKWVIDNAILMNSISKRDLFEGAGVASITTSTLKGKRFGVFPEYKENELYTSALKELERLGAILIELESKELTLNGFLKLLNADMKNDLPHYFVEQGNAQYASWNVAKVMQWNLQDSLRSMPYGQRLFQGILDEPNLTEAEFTAFKNDMTAKAQAYFDGYIDQHQLDGFVSINNYDAGTAAVGFYPALTVPMGYSEEGQPFGLSFIAPSGGEAQLYHWAQAYERATKHRQFPKNYK